jgi:hypothetical protein
MRGGVTVASSACWQDGRRDRGDSTVTHHGEQTVPGSFAMTISGTVTEPMECNARLGSLRRWSPHGHARGGGRTADQKRPP